MLTDTHRMMRGLVRCILFIALLFVKFVSLGQTFRPIPPTIDSATPQLVIPTFAGSVLRDSTGNGMDRSSQQISVSAKKTFEKDVPAAALKNKISSATHGLKPITPDWKEMLSEHKFSVSNEGVVDRNYFGDGYYYMNNFLLTGSVNVARIPFRLQFLRQDYFSALRSSTNTYQAQFDKDGFLDNYRKKLKDSLKLDDLVPKDEVLHQAGQSASAKMKAAIDSMKQEYMSMFGAGLPGSPDTIRDYVKQNAGQFLKSQLNTRYTQLIREKEARLQQLREKGIGKLDGKDAALADSLKKEIGAYYKLIDYYKRYQELSKKLDLPGLNKKMTKEEIERVKKYEEMLNDPASLKSLAEKHLPMSGTEKMFMNVEKLALGQQTISLSPLSLNGYLHKGFSLELVNDNKYFFIMAGKEQDLAALYDKTMLSGLSQNDHTALGIRTGRGPLTGDYTHVSLFMFRQSKQMAADSITGMPHKSVMVAGLNNRITIGETSAVEFELSRSAVTYSDAQYAADTTGRKSAFTRLLGGQDLGQSIAVMGKYQGNFSAEGLQLGAALSHVAAGYYNPGNPFLARGATQAELSIKKQLWEKKVQVNLKGNIREYKYGGLVSSRWRNTSFLTEVRFKLKNGQQLGIRYQPVRGAQLRTDSGRVLNNSSDAVTIDLHLQQRLGNVFYRNMISTVYNNTKYLFKPGEYTKVQSVTLTSLQSIALGTHLLYVNSIYAYAHNPSAYVFFNSSYTEEAGFTYAMGKKLNASSAFNYSGGKGWYEQLGLRQTITATITPKLDFSFYIDKKVNVRQQAEYYDDLLRVDWSLKYNF